MHSNYDSRCSKFERASASALSPDVDFLSAFVAIHPQGTLQAMLINQEKDRTLARRMTIEDLEDDGSASLCRYSEAFLDVIVSRAVPSMSSDLVDVSPPAYSFTGVALRPGAEGLS